MTLDKHPGNICSTSDSRGTSQLLPALKEFVHFLNIEIRVDRFLRNRLFFRTRRRIALYLRKAISIAVEAAVLTGAVWFLCTFLLHVFDVFWRLYLQTPTGGHYSEFFPRRAEIIGEIAACSASWLAWTATRSALIICMGVGAVGRFMHINRHFYLSRGVWGKLLFWGGGLTALVTGVLYVQYDFSGWQGIAVVAAVPTLCMFRNCYRYAEKLIPELGDVFRWTGMLWTRAKHMVIAMLR